MSTEPETRTLAWRLVPVAALLLFATVLRAPLTVVFAQHYSLIDQQGFGYMPKTRGPALIDQT